MNTLVRSGHIELVDYIEPTHPQQVYNYPDLFAPQYPIYDRVPSYHTIDRWNINSVLENAINLDSILWLILFFILIFIVKYLTFRFLQKHENIVFTKGISSSEITFTRDYQELLTCRLGEDPSYDIIYKNTYYHILNFNWTIFDIIDFLKSLDEQDYAVTFELVSKNQIVYFSNYPKIILSNEFMLNKCSDPVLISSLLSRELENIYQMFDAGYNKKYYIIIHYTVLIASR